MKKEYQLGEIFTTEDGETAIVRNYSETEGLMCDRCMYYANGALCAASTRKCLEIDRTDKTSVIFKKIDSIKEYKHIFVFDKPREERYKNSNNICSIKALTTWLVFQNRTHSIIRNGKVVRAVLLKKGTMVGKTDIFQYLKDCPLIYTFVTRYKGKFRLAFIISNLLTP